MSESKTDVILHPVRMRIIQSLVSEPLTVQQMKERMPDIPQATLYRHLKKLFESKVVFVVDEQQIRGTVEKWYALQPKEVNLGTDELANYNKEQYMTLFMKYMSNIMAEYERYVSQEKVDFVKDGVSLRQASLYLSDEEFTSLIQELGQVYSKVLTNKQAPDRKKRTFANIIIPEPNE
ncbi:helix-turn-helix domain-containing protein [Robertmurraya korlensis]|uniref:helix-turn-helix domain-containing protein n=1 Tax=Robertmurraya korlensis TaxID=519977 RepID=UPI00203F2B25|nr:helix-turn-helix domain-containing protein [Robertmurraya korlensis]MCM3601368.1 helix-turn-helix domain-containing protein [Robertmurraya korlensis]